MGKLQPGQIINNSSNKSANFDLSPGNMLDPSHGVVSGINPSDVLHKYSAPNVLGGMNNAGAPPTPPDYVAGANATAAGNLHNAGVATQANRPDQNGVNGSVQWTNSGTADNPHWTQTTSLNGGMQNLYNQGLNAHIDTSKLYNAPAQGRFDTSGVSQLPVNAGMTGQNAIMSRLAPQQERDTNALNNSLANQGIAVGSEAYNTAKQLQGQQQNDAQQQAAMQGIGLDFQGNQQGMNNANMSFQNQNQANQIGMANRQQGLNEQVTSSMLPIQAMNGLNQGSQINNPAVSQQAYTAGADVTGAQNALYGGQMNGYNAQVGNQNSMNQGLFGMGAAAIGAMSDLRLKRNIKRIGTHTLGIGIYTFDYLWGRKSIGVMAQEVLKVRPSAVSIHPTGYFMVNYGALS